MPDLSRRRLFGLLAGAAATPMVGKAAAPLMLGGTPIFYDEYAQRAHYYVNPELRALLQRRINQAHAVMLENMKTHLYGPTGGGLNNLLETENG